MFYVKARVVIKVAGISAPYEKMCSYLVGAPNVAFAKQKFESQVRRDNSNMEAQSFKFEYTEIASTI